MYGYCLRRWKSGNRARCISVAVAITICFVLYVATNSLQQQRQQQQVEPLLVAEEVGGDGGDVAATAAGQLQKQLKYVVETSTCKIPEMSPFDGSTKDFLYPDLGYPVDCKAGHKSRTFVNERNLVINTTAVHESGYSMSSIHCCYRIIERVEQPWSDFDINADNYIKYSDKCHPIFNGTVTIDADFIRVHCIAKLPPLYNDVVYRDFFAVVQPSSDRLVSRKLSNWKPTTTSTPPNVVIIGVDNNSRINGQRHLQKTLQVLGRIGTVELMGYTKVAENTNPNTVPFLSGYSVQQLRAFSYKTDEDPQDSCPFIWKAFDSANYLTVHAEVSPYLGGFNYLRTGFVKKPTDFYLRPLMLACTIG